MGSGAHRWKNLRRLTFSTVVIRPAIDSAGDIGRQLAEIDLAISVASGLIISGTFEADRKLTCKRRG